MPSSSLRTEAPRLRAAIKAYRIEKVGSLDEAGRSLLTELEKNGKAAQAFRRLMEGAVSFGQLLEELERGRRLPRAIILSPPRCNYTVEQKAAELLTICIEADSISRAFQSEIAITETVLLRLGRLDHTISEMQRELGKLFAVVDKHFGTPPHLQGLAMFKTPSDRATLDSALNLISRWVNHASSLADANIARLGATRKKRAEGAAENAAIWHLGAQVRTVVGEPHWDEVAEIANVILKTDQVTGNRVRHIVRKGAKLYAEMIGNKTHLYYRQKSSRTR
jgi:hypothetical protein